ncbi:MAG: cell division protein ZapA [Pseudomonadota bacterium]
MAIVTVVINDKNFQIACNDGEEARLQSAGDTLRSKIDALKAISPRATTEFLLVMCALGLQDEVTSLQNKLTNMGDTGEDDKVAETLSTIAGYLESLAEKIAK